MQITPYNTGENQTIDVKKAALITCLLTGGGLLLFFAVQARQDLPLESRSDPNWALIAGLCFFAAGLLLFQREKIYDWCNSKLEKIADWFGINAWQLILLMMSPAFAVLATNAAGFWKRIYSPAVAVTAWILGIAFAVIGGTQWRKEKIYYSRTTWFWALFLVIIAFFLRGIATERIPILLTGDEASAGITALEFVKGDWNNIFTTAWYSFPSFFSFVQSLSIRVFGPSIQALRIPSAIIGALTVAATYLGGKKMFNHWAGLLAALFLSAFHYHIHFSRLGLNNIWDGFWYVVAISALWYGWEHENRSAYLLAGISIGFAQYFYTSSRGLFAIIIIGILLAALFQRSRLRRAWPHFLMIGLVTLAIVLPLALFYFKQPDQFFAPIRRVTILGNWLHQQITITGQPAWWILLKQISLGFQAYTYAPVTFWYVPGTPLLRPIAVALFYIGLISLIIQNRNSQFVLLSLWLIVFSLIGGLSDSAPASQRYVAVAPACALIIGHGLQKSAQNGAELWPKLSKVFVALTYVIIVITMISDLYFYFYKYTLKSQIDEISSNGMIAQQLANYLQKKPANTQAAFFVSPNMGYYSIASIRYLAPQVQGIDVAEPWREFDRSQLNNQKIIFIFLPSRESEIDYVLKEYPGGSFKVMKTLSNQVLFWIYDYSAGQ